jgi:hypothetical protein
LPTTPEQRGQRTADVVRGASADEENGWTAERIVIDTGGMKKAKNFRVTVAKDLISSPPGFRLLGDFLGSVKNTFGLPLFMRQRKQTLQRIHKGGKTKQNAININKT